MKFTLTTPSVDWTWPSIGRMKGLIMLPEGATILTTAKDDDLDLIAMATHGGGEVAWWTLGSVAERVVSHSSVPVMLLPVMEYKPPTLKAEWFKGA